MNKEKILVIGGGGHARVVVDLIEQTNEFTIAGVVDNKLEKGTMILGKKVLGGDKDLPSIIQGNGHTIAIGVGSTKDNALRQSLFMNALRLGCVVPTLKHPSAVVAQDVVIKDGAQLMAGVIIQSGTTIGENTIVNTGAQVDHDCMVGGSVHICPGVVLSGGVTVGSEAFIGAGAVVIQGIRIGSKAVVGAGAVVVRDVPDGAVVKGVPAK